MRYLTVFVVAAFFVILIFLGLSYLVSEPNTLANESRESKSFDFIRHKNDNELKAKSRLVPPKPQTKPTPPKPQMRLSSQQSKPNLQSEKINMPKINLPTNFKGDLLNGVNVGTGNMEVIPLVRMAPLYPKKALRLKKEGFVTMSFTINPDGTVRNVKVIESQPKELFDNAAINAIKKWKFKAKLVDGKAIAQDGKQTINFTLKND